MKTYSAATYRRARREWAEGGFGPEWGEARRLSWEHGFPLPPLGSGTDVADEDEFPSQRSIIWRALDYRPKATLAIIEQSHSWSQVVAAIMGEETRLRLDAERAETALAAERRLLPSRTEAAGVLDRMGWQR